MTDCQECISLTDEIEQLKKQNNKLSTGLIKYMVMVLKMVQVMDKNGLSVEAGEITEECL
jgi:hypothetical protein